MSTFEQKVSTIEGNLVKEDNKTEVVLFKASTGAGKTNEVQKRIIDSLEKDSEKVFVVLFSTLHELDNFYIDLKIKYDNASSTIKPFNCVVKRTSLNKSYPSAHLTDLETLTLSHYKITGISKWMKSRLLNTSSSNTDVFLLSSVYTYPIDYSFKVSGVWAEILLFIEYRKYVSTLEEKQLKLKLKSGKEITIVNSEILKINKSILTEGEIQTYLFIDEADRYIKSSVLQTLKVDKLSFKGGGISFKERLSYTGLSPIITHKTVSNFQRDHAEIHLSLKAFPSDDKKSLSAYDLKNGNDIKVIFYCDSEPMRLSESNKQNSSIGEDIQSRSIKDVYFVTDTCRYHVLKDINKNHPQFNVEQLNCYLADGLQIMEEFSINGKLLTTRTLINLLLASHNSSIYRVVALDPEKKQIISHQRAQKIHQNYKAESIRCREEKLPKPKLSDYLNCNDGYQLYTFSLQTLNGASFARFKESFNHISCISATWDENLTEVFFNSRSLQQRINFSCSSEEKYNVLLFLNSREFQKGMSFILSSPMNFNYLVKRKLREKKANRKNIEKLLKEISKKDGTTLYDVRSFSFHKTGSLSFINFFVHFLNATFNGNMKDYSLKKFFQKRDINPARKQLLLKEFKNHPVYSIVLETRDSYVKIKPLIFTCTYVSSEPISTRENLSDVDCIILAFINIMFNLNMAGGKDFIKINILNLFSCYDSSEKHSRKIGDNYQVIKERGNVSSNVNYMGANFDADDDLDFLDFEDNRADRKSKILGNNKATFSRKRELLNKEFENTTVFSEIPQSIGVTDWENHFDSVALSSKHGVLKAAINLPDYSFICCNHTRQPLRFEFIHDCSKNKLVFQPQSENFSNNHVQALGRNTRVTPAEKALHDNEGQLPVRLYFLGNFFTKDMVKYQKDKADREVNFLIQELTNNSIFDKDSIEIKKYDYSSNLLTDLDNIYRRIGNAFLGELFAKQKITTTNSELESKPRDHVIKDRELLKKNLDQELRQIMIDDLLGYLTEDPYLSGYLYKSSIQIIICTGGTITEAISREIAKYVSKPNAIVQSSILSMIKNSPKTKNVFLGGNTKSITSIFSYSVEVYFNVFFPDTNRIPTVVLSIDNLVGINKDVTQIGKSFLKSTGLGIPRYKDGPKYKNEMDLIKKEFKELSSEWIKKQTTLEYLKRRLSSFETVDGEEVIGEQFKTNKRRGRDTLYFEISMKKNQSLFNLEKIESADVDDDFINKIFSRL